MVKLEKFGHLQLVDHFTIPLTIVSMHAMGTVGNSIVRTKDCSQILYTR